MVGTCDDRTLRTLAVGLIISDVVWRPGKRGQGAIWQLNDIESNAGVGHTLEAKEQWQ